MLDELLQRKRSFFFYQEVDTLKNRADKRTLKLDDEKGNFQKI